MIEARLSKVPGSERISETAKGAAAEVYEPHNEVSKSAGLRENMSQTVTKVESCHWSKAGLPPCIDISIDREFF